MSTMIAVDPGGVHVGIAGFSYGDDERAVCVRAFETTPSSAEDLIWAMVETDTIRALVVETWRLFPEQAVKQVGSDMPTSQLIGALRWMARYGGVPLILQDPVIKRPTMALLNGAGIRSRAVKEGRGGHAKDAELHGWCWLMQTGRTGIPNFSVTKREARTRPSRAGHAS